MVTIKNPLIVAGSIHNRLTSNPQKGDAVYLGGGTLKFVKFDTLYISEIPSTWIAVGVVQAPKDANGDVLICEKSNAARKAADVFRFKVVPTASYLDGQSHTVAVKLHDVAQTDFTFTASTVQEYATALNTYLRNSVTAYTYWAYYDATAECIYMFLGNYTAYEGGTNTIGGATVTKWIYAELTAYSSLKSVAGEVSGNTRTSYWQMLNRARVIEYLTTSTSSTYNPVTFAWTYPVSYICWQTSVCDTVRAQYETATGKTGKDAWIEYLDDNFVCDIDAANTATADATDPLTGYSRRNGYRNTYALASATYKDIDGAEQYLYPAMRYAADCAYDIDGLRAGSWFVPSIYEGFQVDSDLTYGLSGITRATADIVNRCLNVIGGTAIACTSYHWYSSRCSINSAWSYGNTGNSSSSYYYNSFTVRRFSLYHIA